MPRNIFPDAPKRRLWFPLGVVLLAAGLAGWMHVTEAFYRSFASIMLAPLALLLIGIWWVFLTGGVRWSRRLLRLVVLILAGGLVVGAGFGLLRYEGSLDGAAVPRLVWRWTPTADERLARLAAEEAPARLDVVEAPIPAGVTLGDFTQFQGSSRTGAVPGRLSTDWGASPPRELWRRPVGLGLGGVAVAGRRAVTQEQWGDEERIRCYELVSGALVWEHVNPVRFSEGMGGDGPRATPTIADGRVYCTGATGLLDCLQLSDGTRLWSVDVLDDLNADNLQWGKSNSPLVQGDRVIVTGGHDGEAAVAAYRREDGRRAWATGSDDASYSSPVVMSLHGEDLVVTVLATSVVGMEPEFGEVLWEYPWPGKMAKTAQPVALGADEILVSSSYGMGSLRVKIERPGPKQWAAETVWKTLKFKTKYSSAHVIDGHAYGLDEGRVVCIDLEDGSRLWRGAKFGYGQNLQVGENLILFQLESGAVALVEPDPEGFLERTRFQPLSERTWNPPTLAGNLLIVRNDVEMACYVLPVD